jgi:hypothetical protein
MYRLRIKDQDLFYEECVIKYPTAMKKEKSRDSVRKFSKNIFNKMGDLKKIAHFIIQA